MMNSTTTQLRTSPRCMALAAAILFMPIALLVPRAAQAQGDVYLCVDSNGRKELTDSYRNGCKALNIAGGIPAPSAASAPRRAPTNAGSAPRPPVTTPADFPRVDNAQQKARDNDRREILAEELRNEEQRLAEMRAEYKNGQPDRLGNERNYAKYQERVALLRDNIGRAERNVEALQREISKIR